MADDHGQRRTEQDSAPIHVAVPNNATIVDGLAPIIGVHHAVLNLANAFFSISHITDSQNQFALTTMGVSSVSSKLPAHQMSWDGSLKTVPDLFP